MSFGLLCPFVRLQRMRSTPAAIGAAALALLAGSLFVPPIAAAQSSEVPPIMNVWRQSDPGAPADSGRTFAQVWVPRHRTGALHLHGGVFSPIKSSNASPMLGARFGIHAGDPLLLGFRTGWTYHARDRLDTTGAAPPGFGLQPSIVRAKGEAHLLPAMAFLQVTLTEKLPIVPYVGIGAGYEWLMLRVRNYDTGLDTSITYGNWAWEWYAGMGLKLSQGLRLDAEAFYNGGTLGRDVTDANGVVRREVVDVDGAGARIGLHIVY